MIQRIVTKCLLVVGLMLLPLLGVAQTTIAGWNPVGPPAQSAYGTQGWAPTTTVTGLTYGGLTRASGVGTSGTAAGSAWGGTMGTANVASSAAALTANMYVSWSMTTAAGYQASLSTYDLFYRRSGSGPASGLLQYAIGAGSYSDIATLSFSNSGSSGAAITQVSLSGISALQNVAPSTTINFRILFYGNTTANGTWYVYSSAGMAIGGTVTAAVQPAVAITTTPPANSNVTPSTTNVVLQQHALAVTTADATLSSVKFVTAGTYTAADVSNFKLYYTTTNTFATTNQLGTTQAAAASGSTVTFSGLSQAITNGSTGYLWLTTDVAASPTNGNTISTASGATTDFTFVFAGTSGTFAAGSTKTVTVTTPSIAISANHPAAGSINQNSTNQNIAGIKLATTVANSSLTDVTFTTAGTYSAADLQANSFKLYFTTTNTFATTTQLGTAQPVVGPGGTVAFTGLSQAIATGTSGYLWLTVDVAATADASKNISIAATPFTAINFVSGTKTGTNPVPGSNAKTFATVTPTIAVSSSAVGTGNINVSSTGNYIYGFSTSVTANTATVTGVTFPITANSTADFTTGGFKLYYNTTNSLSGATQLGTGATLAGGNAAFSGFTQTVAAGTTGYFFLTADVAAAATVGNTITATALPLANITYSVSVSQSGTTIDAGTQTIIGLPYTAFDDFNRTDNNTVGIPTSGGVAWTEIETSSAPARASIQTNMLRLSSSNAPLTGPAGGNANGHEMVSYDVSSKYSTVLNNSSSNLEWYFNMNSDRAAPSGFASANYGTAFILGADAADFSTANGYAVIIGNTGSPDPVKLVTFTGGLGSVTDVAASTETGETAYYSVHVIYSPCSGTWSLQVRNDGAIAFADPTSGTYGTAVTGVNTTNVSRNLKYIGAYWQHASPASGSQNAWFDNFYIPTTTASSGVYTWNGTTSTDYQTPQNWTPIRTCPRASDVLQFNSSSPASATVSNIPTQTISQLLVTNNRTLTLKDATGDAAASTLTLNGATGTDLVVEAGSSLTFDVASTNATADAMVVSLATGATGNIAGQLTFTNSNSGNAGRPHQLLAADAGAITVANGGVITALHLSGSPFGTSASPVNIITFAAGSAYESYDGSNPFGLTQPASKIVLATGSTYRQKQIGAPSIFGRTFGNLEVDVTGTLPVTFGGTGTFTVDSLRILNGTFNITTAAGNTANTAIKGGLTIASGATFTYNPGTASTLTFNGASQQIISGAGTLTLGALLNTVFNNTATSTFAIDVQKDLTINGTATFTNGIIGSTTGNILQFADNAAVSGAGSSSYFSGPVSKAGDDAFIFPIGKVGTGYLPVSITAPAVATDVFTAEYLRGNATTLGAVDPAATSINHVSSCDYWTLNRAGSSSVDVTLTWGVSSGCGPNAYINSLSALRVAHFNTGTGMWEEAGTGNYSVNGTTSAGSITVTGVSSFSPFSLASSNSGQNPLPVKLEAFTGTKLTATTARLNWTAHATEGATFTVLRSTDGTHFQPLNTQAAQGNITDYTYTDNSLQSGANTYRLQLTDNNGDVTNSNTITLYGGTQHFAITGIAPNHIRNQATVQVTTAAANNCTLRVTDAMGRTVINRQQQLPAGNSTFVLDAAALSVGTYTLQLISAEGETAQQRFTKE